MKRYSTLGPATFEDAKARLRAKQGKRPARYGLGRQKAKTRTKRTLYAGTMWSQDVKKRDDYTCQRCRNRSKQNHAHHVAPRSRRPDLRFDRANGKTFCPDCHRWVHENPIESTATGLLSDETYEKVRKAA